MDGPDPYYYRQSQKNTAYHNNYEVLMKTAKRCDTTRLAAERKQTRTHEHSNHVFSSQQKDMPIVSVVPL